VKEGGNSGAWGDDVPDEFKKNDDGVELGRGIGKRGFCGGIPGDPAIRRGWKHAKGMHKGNLLYPAAGVGSLKGNFDEAKNNLEGFQRRKRDRAKGSSSTQGG